jgi:phosphate transport system permease protein
MSDVATPTAPPPGPDLSLKARGRSRGRLFKNRLAEVLATLAALAAVAVLAIMVWSVFERAVDALSWNFFTKGDAVFGETGGGIAPAIVGTFMLIVIATVIALPIGALIAIFVSEFAKPEFARQMRVWLDILNGFPSIVIGIFVYELAVKQATPLLGLGHKQSAYAGGFALSIIMIPLIARTTMEVLSLVPTSLREASYGLGVSKWRTVLSIVLPSALGGIVTGTTLAVARAAGETAPLLFTCSIFGQTVSWDPSQAVASIPIKIFEYSESPDKNLNAQAWAAAFVLIMFVLVTSLVSRILLDRSRRKLGQTH